MSTTPRRFSFEFFPPKTDKGMEKLYVTQDKLAAKKPAFFSVTYGAGGSTRERTLNTVFGCQERTGSPVAPHLACVGDTREHLVELIQLYQSKGIQRIVSLRGDMPSGMGLSSGDLAYASDLVALIRAETGDHFHLEVAAYPEVHPQAKSADDDLNNFFTKVNAGANSAITQYFFNIDAFYDFKNRCAQRNVTIPIFPGIMPITNFSSLVRFSDMCGAEIPRWIRKRLESYGDDLASIGQFGEEVVTRLCQQLLAMDCPGLHFYTLNQAEPTLALWNNLNLDSMS